MNDKCDVKMKPGTGIRLLLLKASRAPPSLPTLLRLEARVLPIFYFCTTSVVKITEGYVSETRERH